MVTMRKAMTAVLHEVMQADDNTIMLGEALDTRGGCGTHHLRVR